MVDSDDFLDFLPPLWLLVLVLDVAFFPDAVDVLAVLSVEPPVACANDRLAPSSSVNAIVSSFFIQFLRMRFSCGSLRLLTQGPADSFRWFQPNCSMVLKSGLLGPSFKLAFPRGKAACPAALPELHPKLFRRRCGGPA